MNVERVYVYPLIDTEWQQSCDCTYEYVCMHMHVCVYGQFHNCTLSTHPR